jgi:hypothetical protein
VDYKVYGATCDRATIIVQKSNHNIKALCQNNVYPISFVTNLMSSLTSEAPIMQMYRLEQCCVSYNVVAHLIAEKRTSLCSFIEKKIQKIISSNYAKFKIRA